MFCKWCGAPVTPSDQKCSRCGREIPALSDCGGFYDLVPEGIRLTADDAVQKNPEENKTVKAQRARKPASREPLQMPGCQAPRAVPVSAQPERKDEKPAAAESASAGAASSADRPVPAGAVPEKKLSPAESASEKKTSAPNTENMPVSAVSGYEERAAAVQPAPTRKKRNPTLRITRAAAGVIVLGSLTALCCLSWQNNRKLSALSKDLSNFRTELTEMIQTIPEQVPPVETEPVLPSSLAQRTVAVEISMPQRETVMPLFRYAPETDTEGLSGTWIVKEDSDGDICISLSAEKKSHALLLTLSSERNEEDSQLALSLSFNQEVLGEAAGETVYHWEYRDDYQEDWQELPEDYTCQVDDSGTVLSAGVQDEVLQAREFRCEIIRLSREGGTIRLIIEGLRL